MSNKTTVYAVTAAVAALAILGFAGYQDFTHNQMKTPVGFTPAQGTMSDPANPSGPCYQMVYAYPDGMSSADAEAYAFDPANAAHVSKKFATTCGNSRG